MKLGENVYLLGWSFFPSFMRIGQKLWFFLLMANFWKCLGFFLQTLVKIICAQYLTLLKLGAPSVCGASLTNLSIPSKWSVIAKQSLTLGILAIFSILVYYNWNSPPEKWSKNDGQNHTLSKKSSYELTSWGGNTEKNLKLNRLTWLGQV